MTRFISLCLLALVLPSFLCVSCKEADVILLPTPASFQCGRGHFEFTADTVIYVEDEQQRQAADWFAWLFAKPAGFVPKISGNKKKADVILHRDESLGKEAYRIEVRRRRIFIEASSQPGFFYALQTLRFVLPSAISSNRCVPQEKWLVPTMKVEDAPGFRHRCLRLDVSENYVPVANILSFIDCMAMLKLNHLHIIMDFGALYSRQDHEQIIDFAAENHVAITPESGCLKDMYVFPDDTASKLFPEIAALSEVAWTAEDIADVMHFNHAVEHLKEHLRYKGLGGSEVIYNIAVAALK